MPLASADFLLGVDTGSDSEPPAMNAGSLRRAVESFPPVIIVRFHGDSLREKRVSLLQVPEVQQDKTIVEDDRAISVVPVVVQVSISFKRSRPVTNALKLARGSEVSLRGVH